jgi:hypothetical protein
MRWAHRTEVLVFDTKTTLLNSGDAARRRQLVTKDNHTYFVPSEDCVSYYLLNIGAQSRPG